ncbi:MAG: Cof-type HAD-IIB family hydrolase [Clostridiales Family XIII bacterium]|nr:Cof-type HAD-IIB family hydrolase [Clostridiales Family XIII bacterium]
MRDFNGTIGLIATDLDGTLLDTSMTFTERDRAALGRCIAKGIHVVVATGRSLTSVPQAVRDIEGIEALICVNGAKIYDNKTEEPLYARYLSREAIESVWDLINADDVMCEVFTGGRPYVSAACFDDLARYGIPDWFAAYARRSRRPVDDLISFTSDHLDAIENINFNFGDEATRLRLLNRLSGSGLYELTSAFPFNYEIGGVGVNKAEAIDFLCRRLGVPPAETMCFGDNVNDVGMIRYAGIGVAMGDAAPEAREAADFVTLAGGRNGIAHAIDRFIP